MKYESSWISDVPNIKFLPPSRHSRESGNSCVIKTFRGVDGERACARSLRPPISTRLSHLVGPNAPDSVHRGRAGRAAGATKVDERPTDQYRNGDDDRYRPCPEGQGCEDLLHFVSLPSSRWISPQRYRAARSCPYPNTNGYICQIIKKKLGRV